ncbi:uncharacterized protein LOC111451664 isoform X2 [Cucurbita moschata]|uniref:Uncharacterized protein LOC111451664 isoform X2 n=1 Tax=Cucurbita moschata TaxID=3662 RepID=A0A6J1G899_CUCMO|nr:uncharacterized protein LOC111451664 isoform X2 [Cucurbita moschata]
MQFRAMEITLGGVYWESEYRLNQDAVAQVLPGTRHCFCKWAIFRETQAADPYSRRIFRKFQEELVETLANPTTKIDDTGAVASSEIWGRS